MTDDKMEELGPEEWEEMLEHDREADDPNNAMTSPLGLTEEAKGNLTFMAATLAAILIFSLFGGWYYFS
jgi:hypothetical protein